MAKKENSEPAFRHVWSDLRSQILNHDFSPDTALPTELELAHKYSVSRQTVRRAFLDLVSEDLVFRVPGRGTFVTPSSKRYLRHFGSVDDLMSLSADTQLQVLHALTTAVDPAAASRLRLPDDRVATVIFLRFHQGEAFSHTTAYLPPLVRAQLGDVKELTTSGATTSVTLIGLLDAVLDSPIQDVEQSITVVAMPAEVAESFDLPTSTFALRIDRMYFDTNGAPVELAISYYHPDRYSYRIRLRRNPM
jgi:DNA-binding GntR family transcriptional regulator